MARLTAWLRGRHPAQYLVAAFAIGIVVGAGLLLLPFATESGESTSFLTAMFTSTSAICVTGLVVVDTPTYWSTFGEVVIMVLVQVGGLGIMTLASLLIFVLAGKLGLRGRLLAQAEVAAPLLADVRRLVFAVVKLSLIFEAIGAVILAVRWWTGYDYSLGRSIYLGIFHAITAFNNAGFALWTDSLTQFATDGWISVTMAVLIIAGGLGFPVWLELSRLWRRPHSWSLHTKLTVLVTAVLVVGGTGAVLAFEWSNPGTLGPFDVGGKLLTGFFQGVTPRTAGFNTVDYGEMELETLFVSDFLMFVGAGSASTGGGIKVTTLALLALMVWSELRGDPHVTVFSRRLPAHAQRQAFADRHDCSHGRRRQHARPHGQQRVHPLAIPLRGLLGLRDGGALDRDHGGYRRSRPVDPDPAHVPRPRRAAYTRRRSRPARAAEALPFPRGATDHRLINACQGVHRHRARPLRRRARRDSRRHGP